MKDRTIKTVFMMVLDALVVFTAGVLALLMRFDLSLNRMPDRFMDTFLRLLPLEIAVTWLVFFACRMYHYIWHNVSAQEVMYMWLAVLLNFAVFHIPAWFLAVRQPRSAILMALVFQSIGFLGVRCSVRFYQAIKNRRALQKHGGKRIMLIGAGQAGQMLLKEMQSSQHTQGKVVCIIDDNPNKKGKYLEGVRIVGGRRDIAEIVKNRRITDIIIAIPSLGAESKKELLSLCKETGCRMQILPGIYQLVNGEVSISTMREVRIEDLLGREPVRLDLSTVSELLHDKVVLVTGGGGSIGSELCRQIAGYSPKKLLIVDCYENNAYAIQQELRRAYGDRLDLVVEMASVRDKKRIYEIFDEYRPEVVFHAAAHKHVPLMEDSPAEAVKNNIFGTYHVVRAAEKFGTRKFILISTDKAVNPTNVMGASKRFCEMVLQSRASSTTEYCAVRFGNVLGSNGSVVPLFKDQIAAGGPVTVTDKRITRFFMTIPEAVQLILEAGTMAHQNQIFVLDMGEPVKILDLAENLIRLSGLKPYEDIDIVEIGLRPGEKLYEELLMQSEHLTKTENKKIFIEEQQSIDRDTIMAQLEELDRAVSTQTTDEEMRTLLKRMVPTYHDPEEVNAAKIAAAMATEA